MILLLFIINQDIDFEDLYNKATTLLVQFQTEKDSAFEILVELGQDTLYADTVIDFLVSKFDTKSAIERHRMKDIFKKISTPAINGIVKKIDYRGKDEESRHLKQSLWVLGEISSDEIVEPVARFIKDEQWQIRSGAYTALGKSESKNALPYIIQGIDDSISIVRKSAYYALSRLATEHEILYLICGLDDEFYGVRYAAVAGLLNIGEKAFSPLVEKIGENSLKDYFIFKTLLQFDIDRSEKKKILKYLDDKEAPIRLLIYEGFEGKFILKSFIKLEHNELLKNYIIKKISNYQ